MKTMKALTVTAVVLLFYAALTQSTESRLEKAAANLQSLLKGATKRDLDRFERNHEPVDVLVDKLDALESKITHQMAEIASICQGARVFLRRQDGSVNFSRSWNEYRDGFGDREGEFWLGLTSLHRLTSHRDYRLRVDLLDWSGERKWAEYERFAVGPESEKFKLSISGYNPLSTAGDSILYGRLDGFLFSTYDQDNDLWKDNCALTYKGGWWFNGCGQAEPTGLYKPDGYRGWDGINWYSAYGDTRSFKAVTFKLVPV